jgi:hypothetical protein
LAYRAVLRVGLRATPVECRVKTLACTHSYRGFIRGFDTDGSLGLKPQNFAQRYPTVYNAAVPHRP